MTFLTYLLATVVAFSGVIAGSMLALNTKEEMPTAKKYFPLLQKVLFIAVIAALLNHFKLAIIVKVIVYLLVLFIILRKKQYNFYPFIAVIFFLLGQSQQSLFTISILMFLFGFPTGSLFVIYNKKMKWFETVKRVTLKYGIFLVIAIALQLLYSLFVLKTIS
mgnify:CR=1 FL=1|tara:strand:+ start:1765 stop:2253 length:489 start_codon:yes stop_codon:yes gene_type:complete